MKANVEEHSFKPQINKASKKITQELTEKLEENKIPRYELLLYKGKEYMNKKIEKS